MKVKGTKTGGATVTPKGHSRQRVEETEDETEERNKEISNKDGTGENDSNDNPEGEKEYDPLFSYGPSPGEEAKVSSFKNLAKDS